MLPGPLDVRLNVAGDHEVGLRRHAVSGVAGVVHDGVEAACVLWCCG
jgi:hypothetical protein